MKIFNNFVNKNRTPDQNLQQYMEDLEGSYNQLVKLGAVLKITFPLFVKECTLDTELQIVTANLEFSSETKAKTLFEDTKDALNKHQNCRNLNRKPVPLW